MVRSTIRVPVKSGFMSLLVGSVMPNPYWLLLHVEQYTDWMPMLGDNLICTAGSYAEFRTVGVLMSIRLLYPRALIC